jgi:hypothetical protein
MTEDEQPKARRKPGPKPATPKKPAETKEERDQRNYLIFQRFIAGWSERDIARAANITPTRVHQILQSELKNSARHNALLTEEARAVYVGRLETLIKAVWPKVLQQDVKAIVAAARLLEQKAQFDGSAAVAVPPMPTVGGGEGDMDDMDELTRFRMQRNKKPEAGAGGS